MDYQKHYNALVFRAKNRILEGYCERHHIIPRCLGGNDSPDNLVSLTPEEHYVAHQLLVKMYPKKSKLIYAALMMSVHSSTHSRNNKLYGWLRRRYRAVAKQRTGKKNGSYGKPWYHNPETLDAGKFLPGEEPIGWMRGRTPNKKENKTLCSICQRPTGGHMAKFCHTHREEVYFQAKTKYTDSQIEQAVITIGTRNISEIARYLDIAQPHKNSYMRKRIRNAIERLYGAVA